MRSWFGPFVVLAGGLAAVLMLILGRPVDGLLNLCLAVVFVGWGLTILTLPWDLHFQAVGVLRELDRSQARGLRPDVDRVEIARVVRRTRWIAIGAHLVSAAAIGAFAWWSTWPAIGWVALAIAASTGFRPMGAWYRHLRVRLDAAARETRVPREDATELRRRIEALEARCQGLEARADAADTTLTGHDQALGHLRQHTDARFVALTRRFESALEQLTGNRELLAGLRAFLRMIREPSPHHSPGVDR